MLDMRIKTIPIQPQEAMTKDNVPVKIAAVVYYKIVDPLKVVMSIVTTISLSPSTRRPPSAT